MAELEADMEVATTYLLMTESVFYNLASPEGEAAIARLRELGHAVGLHAVHPNVVLDDRFDPVVSWHNPRPEYMSDEIPGAVNAYGTPLLLARDVSLRLEPALALRLPARGVASGAFPWLQILVHPEIWVYPGETMGDTMRAMVEAEGARRLEQLAADGIHL